MTDPQQPTITVVEWGPDIAGDAAGGFWRDPRLAWVPAGLGGAALFGSFASEWQTTDAPEEFADLSMVAGLPALGALGSGWVVGAILLVTCVGLALAGQPVIRPFARTAGLVLATVLAGVLLAIALYVDEPIAYRSIGLSVSTEYEVTHGPGFYLAFTALALLAAAVWLARPSPASVPVPGTGPVPGPETGPGPDAARVPRRPAAPGDLTVGPAEPFTHPTDDHEWR